MENRPLIGITMYYGPKQEGSEGNYYSLKETYTNMVSRAGGIPLLLPYTFDAWDILDGVLLCGGGDVGPDVAKNGNDPGEHHGVTPARDAFELALLREAEARKLPVFGICRGCQLINCAHGGSLVRDLHSAGVQEEHVIEPFGIGGQHPVKAEPGSLMEKLLAGSTSVCSSHHQAVKELGEGFRVTARSPEGVVEAIEHENGRMIGIQSHPEQVEWLEPFLWLTELAKARKA
ncbi:gamma-glutamyl-gamma-aminobutyrate hydrolase family protein [bacterium]|nr:gamma-glutamyl-gamma-aminobutyrate hydrolase family protein [bacterium]MDD5918528.1 gamma-glutamyl-gamma-aminobutyrate hydrolase family protein [bacterium]